MSVCGEEQTPKNERETKTVLNIELLFVETWKRGIAAVDVMV